MQSDLDILNTICNKFPEMDETLTILFQKDENFREVCEDYVLCLSSIGKIIITNKKNDKILKEFKNAGLIQGELKPHKIKYGINQDN